MATRYFQGVILPASEYADGIEGIKVTMDVVDIAGPAFVSLGMDANALWGQVGYIQEIGPKGVAYNAPFFQVWDGGGLLVDYSNSKMKLAPGEHTFEFSELRGTKWAFYVDGKKIGTVDMGDTEVTGPSVNANFTGTEFSSDLPTITFSDYSVKTDGAWHIVEDAFWFTAGDIQPPDMPTGAMGNLQNPSIPDGTWLQGADLPIIPRGTQLWSSADMQEPITQDLLLFAQACVWASSDDDTFAFDDHPGAEHASGPGLLGIQHHDFHLYL